VAGVLLDEENLEQELLGLDAVGEDLPEVVGPAAPVGLFVQAFE